MASTYKHGVYINEVPTSISAPIEGTAGLQVIVGTAPVNTVKDPAAVSNTPILAYTYKEAVEAVGYSDDFAHYTLCEAIDACFNVVGISPIVLINVLDPGNEKFQAEVTKETITATEKKIEVKETGIIISTIVLTDTEVEATTFSAGKDYTASLADDGTLVIDLLESGAAKDKSTFKLTAKKLDPTKVQAADIVGSVDAETGKETGIQVVRQVYPKLNLTPGIITAPRWSKDPTVCAALQANTKEISGAFRAVAVVDIDSTSSGAKVYTAVNGQKTKQALTDPNCYAVWLYGKVGNKIYSGSTLAAALTAYTDSVNADTPSASPSNIAINISAACLDDGTEVMLDREQANTVNSFGIATWLNMNGFRLWGNNTVAYPAVTDPKDRWFSCRRFMNWAGNTFILTYTQKVDKPLNRALIDSIVDSERVRGNSFVARGICARYELVYSEEENPTTELLNGHLTFHQYCTPYTPAEQIEDILEFDANALSAALA